MPKTRSLADERLRDIELLLLWEGAVGNARLRELFGIKIGQASLLLKAYRKDFPKSCLWDTKLRAYVPTQSLNRAKLSGGTLDEYLALLSRSRAPGDSILSAVQQDLTEVRPSVFAALYRAALGGTGVRMSYRSMNNPQAHNRTIFPHSIIRAGRRWHVRGFVTETGDYRDFAIGRIVEASALLEPAPSSPVADAAWNTTLKIRIKPHPGLSAAQRDVVMHEYMRGAPSVDVETRAATLHYLIHELRLAIEPDRETPPDYQLAIAIANVAELRAWLFPGAASASRRPAKA